MDYPTDSEHVLQLTGLDPSRIHPERFRLGLPASPHLSARAENKRIRLEDLVIPSFSSQNLVIEGAGGLMVPLNDDELYIDWLAQKKLPTILVVQTYLGCINHGLLSIEALKTRDIPLAGIILNEGEQPESEGIILARAKAPLLGRLPRMERIDREALLGIPLLQRPLI